MTTDELEARVAALEREVKRLREEVALAQMGTAMAMRRVRETRSATEAIASDLYAVEDRIAKPGRR